MQGENSLTTLLIYDEIKIHPAKFISTTSLTLPEFEFLLPFFTKAYQDLYPITENWEGELRVRKAGGGAEGKLRRMEDKLTFILSYHKLNPLQLQHGMRFQLSQSRANFWIHHLTPALHAALRESGMSPERDGEQFMYTQTDERSADYIIDGTDRPIERPKDAEMQKAHYSGKQHETTDKNIILVNAEGGYIEFLGPTEAGSVHDKKAADNAAIHYPKDATLIKDTGFQAYEPEGVLTYQPTKKPKGKPLDKETKEINQFISGIRIVVEHAIAGIKRCRIVKDALRVVLDYFSDMAMEIACGLHNLRLTKRRVGYK
jgi:hypothetical protein